VTLINKSITKTELEANQFDFAIVRALLQHIPNTDDALKEITRLLKPGGIIYILDGDIGMEGIIEPEMKNIKELNEKFSKMQKSQGGHPSISRYLPKKLKALGYIDIDFHMIALHSQITGSEMFKETNKPETFLPYVKAGVLTENEVHEIVKEGNNWLDNPDAISVGVGFVTVGKKP
jgi:ubiquinone/menaquinone biosynthesis C-methylase UbiE